MDALLGAFTRIPIIETAIGMFFIYLLLSLLVSSLQELFAKWLSSRERLLEDWIKALLDGEDKTQNSTGKKPTKSEQFFEHSLIKSLWVKGQKPSFIPPRSFAVAVLEVFKASNSDEEDAVDKLKEKIKAIENRPVLRSGLLLALKAADNDVEKALDNIGIWFDDAMNSVSTWYKKKSQYITLIISIAAVFALNVDTLAISNALLNNPALRAQLINQALDTQDDLQRALEAAGDNEEDREKIVDSVLQKLDIPIGWIGVDLTPIWDSGELKLPGAIEKLLGLLMTILAVSLGAPFWFDLLNKLLRYRKPKEAKS